jgi:hypothetical protein
MCENFDPNFGDRRTSSYITETHHLTLPFSSANFFYQKQHDCRTPTYPTRLTWPQQFSVSPIGKRNFDTVEMIEAESQAVLNTLTEHGFQDAFKK